MRDQVIAAAIGAFRRGDLARARSLINSRLSSTDDDPFLHHLMGLIECRQGDFESGIRWLRRSLDLDQANVGYRVILARALTDGGRPREALDVARGPTPTAELLHARAEAALAAEARDIESAAWRELCNLKPSEPMLRMNLARSLLAQSRFNEAAAAYRETLSLSPRSVAAFHELGLTLERINKIDDLATLLDRALALGIVKKELAEVWALLELRRRRPDEARRLLEHQPRDADPVRWNHLRARIYDALGDAGAAFAAATAMNRSVSHYASARKAAAGYRARLAALARTITPEWGARLPRLTI